jgi:hypothetical protein
MLHKIEIMKSKHVKVIALLDELKDSVLYEAAKYHLVTLGCVPVRYILFRISDRKELTYGTLEDINSYMRLRNMSESEVFQSKQHPNHY